MSAILKVHMFSLSNVLQMKIYFSLVAMLLLSSWSQLEHFRVNEIKHYLYMTDEETEVKVVV